MSLSRYQGCLLGGAIGDALGYAVEFSSWDRIKAQYGSNGIVDYDLRCGQAVVSDDTQMTLFTAAALLFGNTRGRLRGIMEPTYSGYLWSHYRDWLITQEGRPQVTQEGAPRRPISWLNQCPELCYQRAPGQTCLSALRGSKMGTMENPLNDSKGCGGVMRVAPIGLLCGRYLLKREEGAPHWETLREADNIGAIAAALTHGHELGYIPAAGLVHIVARAAHCPQMDLGDIVQEARQAMAEEFAGKRHLGTMLTLLDRAADLAQQDVDDVEAIAQLGAGWVAEETLAIAIYCALKYRRDFSRAIIAAVNHSGDSDSTGSVTGNILGAYLGVEAIPERWIAPLDCRDIIMEIAADLYSDVPENIDTPSGRDEQVGRWIRKYVEGRRK